MPDEKTNTGAAGAVPADKGANADLPTGDKGAVADSSPEVVTDKDGKPLPWDQQPKWKSARQAEKKLNDLLKANDLDDPDDLLDLVQRGKTVKGKLADINDLDAILERATRLEKYEAYWAEQKKRHERENTDPETRAEKAERELEEERANRLREKAAKQQMEETKKAIAGYEKEVQTLVAEASVPKDHQGFILELFGVGNPSNDVEITDKKAIKKLVADGLRKFDALKQSIIAEYLEDKKGIVKTGQGAEAVGGEKPPRLNLKEARKAAQEQMMGVFRRGG